MAGHGEPLIHPQFDELSRLLRDSLDPRCSIYLITNGQYIDRHFISLKEMQVRTFNISLNAATEKVHEEIMAMSRGVFPRILQSIDRLVEYRDSVGRDDVEVNISMVIVRQNIQETAEFIEMGNRLRVDHIYLRTLMPNNGLPEGLNYHTLPPYLHPEFEYHKNRALRAIETSRIPVEASPNTWDTPIFSQELITQVSEKPPVIISRQEARRDIRIHEYYETTTRPGSDKKTKGRNLYGNLQKIDLKNEDENSGNPYGRSPHFHCRFIYYQLNLNDFFFRLNPCCYMDRVPGFEQVHFDGSFDFFKAWNSDAFVELRKRLKAGPLYSYCRKCPFQG